MTNKECRKIALELMMEQLMNTPYSLERDEYKSLNPSDADMICEEIHKVCQQFKQRYNIK